MVLVLVSAIVTGALRYYLPHIDDYRQPILDVLNENERGLLVAAKEIKSALLKILEKTQVTSEKKYYCSQMRSCEEATFYINNCPNTKMDGGDKDGIPCEKQWCH